MSDLKTIEDFRLRGKEVIDYICEFFAKYSSIPVSPKSDFTFRSMRKKLALDVPEEGEPFKNMLKDIDQEIVPGLLNWNHPGFLAYFSSGRSYPSLLADMLSSAFNQIGFSWLSAPALSDHEDVTLNMFARALGLPQCFQSDMPNSTGGGAMQSSGSDCINVALIAARFRACQMLKPKGYSFSDSTFLPNLVGYTSEEAHSCVEKAAKMAIIRLRILPVDENGSMRLDALAEAIKHDVEYEGFTPCFVSSTVGTTGTCAFDNIYEIGKICEKYPTIWFHVDGAYGGNSFILPEMDKFKRGLEFADSFNLNPNKLLLTLFDCSCIYIKDLKVFTKALSVHPAYLQDDTLDESASHNLRDFGIPLSRRFRSLKLWCVLRSFGMTGLRAYIRHNHKMAKHVEKIIQADDRFSVENTVYLGLVCFRLFFTKFDEAIANEVNMELCERINNTGEIHVTPTTFRKRYIIRLCITNPDATEAEVDGWWKKITNIAEAIISDFYAGKLKFQVQNYKLSPYTCIKSVTKEELENHVPSLKGGGIPLAVVRYSTK